MVGRNDALHDELGGRDGGVQEDGHPAALLPRQTQPAGAARRQVRHQVFVRAQRFAARTTHRHRGGVGWLGRLNHRSYSRRQVRAPR